jgi:hypothetical protein
MAPHQQLLAASILTPAIAGCHSIPPLVLSHQVRNHILTRWRSDVSRFLTEEEAGAKIAARYRHLVPLAWRFLYRHGWINFGVAPAITSYPQPTQKASVVVVGAGLAGEGALVYSADMHALPVLQSSG